MAKIKVEDTTLKGLKIITPFYAEDNRGYFLKAFEKNDFKEFGIDVDISETFESFSVKGVIRGLHFQTGEFAQAKLVRVLSGEVYDVCVDIRPESETFGQWFGMYLSSENHKAFYMEKGFAHGFLVVSDSALMSYTVSGVHSNSGESGIFYKDEDLKIDWPVKDLKVILSDRDAQLDTFKKYCERIAEK